MHWLHALTDPSLRHELTVTRDKLADVSARSLAQDGVIETQRQRVLELNEENRRLRAEIERLRTGEPLP